MRKFLIAVGVAVLILVSAGALVTKAILDRGARAVDLGIRYTAEDIDAVVQKVGVTIKSQDTTTDGSIRYEGKKAVQYELDSKEVTALAAQHARWKSFPFHSVQILVSPDGTVETTGIIDLNKVLPYLRSIGVASEEVQTALEKYPLVADTIAFQLKGSGGVAQGKVNLDIQSAKVAGFAVPHAMIQARLSQLVSVLEHGIQTTPGLEVRALRITGGKVAFEGTIPQTEFYQSE